MFLIRLLGYTLLDFGVAYFAFQNNIQWYIPVLLSSIFFAVVELIYQLSSLNKEVDDMKVRLPMNASNLVPAISRYIREIDDDRNELVQSASFGSMPIKGRVTKYLVKQLRYTSEFYYAISPIDFDMELWALNDRKDPYVDAQKKILRKNIEIRRLFVGLALHEVYEEAISQQKFGIKVKFLVSPHHPIEDLGIFDKSLVYYTDSNGNGRFSTQQDIIVEKTNLFKRLWKEAINIPSTPPDDQAYGINVYTDKDSSFGKESLLHAWADDHVDTGEFMTPSISDSGYREFLLGLCLRISHKQKPLIVLSIGAGTGSFEEYLKDKLFAEVTCIELLKEGVALLQDKGFECHELNSTDLSLLGEKQFSLVLIDGLIVHLGDISFKQTLRESIKHLSVGGKIIVSADSPADSYIRSEPHQRVKDGVIRSQKTITCLARQVGLNMVPNTPTEFPYYRPIKGYTKRAIAVLERE